MKIDTIIAEEKNKIGKIKIATDHQFVRDKWSEVKKILDAIYKEIPPFTDKEVHVNVDIPSLEVKEKISEWVLMSLALEEGICGYTTHRSFKENGKMVINVITSQSAEDYLGGSIVVYDTTKFEVLRTKIVELYDFIKKDGEKRFSETYFPQPPKEVFTQYEIPTLNNYDLDVWMEQGRTEELRRSQETKHHRESLKHARILSSKEDKRIHALKTIKEYTEPHYPQNKSVSIDYYNFNYDDQMDALQLLKAFLTTAQARSCFQQFTHESHVNQSRFSFSEVNFDAIEKYIDELTQSLVSKENVAENGGHGKKIKVFISSDKGIYKMGGGSYPIQHKSKRKLLIMKLKDGKKESNLLHRKPSLLKKEINEINTNFKKRLEVNDDLIQRVPTGGYNLNRETFDIEFLV